ncbi:enoyl-CoA hydratase/isomerase family protein [Mycobacterium sp. E1747]|uniref:enoyl-CoA hydratase/isomerase family protein n=1 Tax=Mycobacterium sp. E1747 TaxID=1834128 RepID=UPI0007FD9742|nr:enoyl-CoA hydratase-related protein [Mycobacterium sp. E1747]OBH11017.1 enoyl-CoA hydratase [Mycobacterium sp. E1747]
MTILTEHSGAVRTITLNRPKLRNAIDIPLRLALADALEAADRDATVRAIVLTGAGPMFCSGGDISTMQRMSPTEALERAQLAQRVIRAIWNTPKPVIAAVEGGAMGAGLALAAACDRVVAAKDARFATTFLNVALAGDMGAYASLPARIGVARTRQMLLMARPVDADTALAQGLVDDLADPGHCLESALEDARALAARPAQALGAIKRMLAEAPRLSGTDVLDLEANQQAELFGSDDFAEGVAAFQEKRTPRFGRTDLPQGVPS